MRAGLSNARSRNPFRYVASPIRAPKEIQLLLTITLTQSPATDLGYVLPKSPGRVHTRSLAFGRSHVFYPEATADRCTAALLLPTAWSM